MGMMAMTSLEAGTLRVTCSEADASVCDSFRIAARQAAAEDPARFGLGRSDSATLTLTDFRRLPSGAEARLLLADDRNSVSGRLLTVDVSDPPAGAGDPVAAALVEALLTHGLPVLPAR